MRFAEQREDKPRGIGVSATVDAADNFYGVADLGAGM